MNVVFSKRLWRFWVCAREVACAVVYMMLYVYVVDSEWGADVGRVQGKM